VLDSLSFILKQTVNIHSLKLTYTPCNESLMNVEHLCAIIPQTVKHLQISIHQFDDMKFILEQLQQLTSVTYYSTNTAVYANQFKRWIELRRPNSLIRDSLHCLHIWLGDSINVEHGRPSIKRVFNFFRYKQIS
jgi:hypothetical protein